jgi:hypothetical protein
MDVLIAKGVFVLVALGALVVVAKIFRNLVKSIFTFEISKQAKFK